MTKQVANGTAHKLPDDLRTALISSDAALTFWQDLTPLSRNEWICWCISVKKNSTRENHIKRTITELKEGKRRPCCWMGCIHRKDKSLSPSVKWVLSKRS